MTGAVAAYAEFEGQVHGQQFFVVSVHLDDRHSGKLSKERKLDRLPGRPGRGRSTRRAGSQRQATR